MANESELRDRWGDIYQGGAEYQDALKRAAIAKATKRQQLQAAIRRAPTAGFGSELQTRLSELDRTPDPTVQGLDDFQEARFRDYVKKTQARGAQEALTAPVSVAQGPRWRQSRMDPDFREAIPYAEWSPRAVMGISNRDIAGNEARKLDTDMMPGYDTPPQDLLDAATRRKKISMYEGVEPSGRADEIFAAETRLREKGAQDKARKIQAEKDRARDADEKLSQFRGNNIMIQRRLADAKDPRLEYFFDNLPDTDKTFMQKLPWEKQVDWLKTHPNWRRSRPSAGSSTRRGMSLVRDRLTGALSENPEFTAFRGQ